MQLIYIKGGDGGKIFPQNQKASIPKKEHAQL
jgi:hypothetical protein